MGPGPAAGPLPPGAGAPGTTPPPVPPPGPPGVPFMATWLIRLLFRSFLMLFDQKWWHFSLTKMMWPQDRGPMPFLQELRMDPRPPPMATPHMGPMGPMRGWTKTCQVIGKWSCCATSYFYSTCNTIINDPNLVWFWLDSCSWMIWRYEGCSKSFMYSFCVEWQRACDSTTSDSKCLVILVYNSHQILDTLDHCPKNTQKRALKKSFSSQGGHGLIWHGSKIQGS